MKWFQGLLTFATVAVLCGSILYGCQVANEKYYAFANACVQNGGTWVSNNQGVYTGLCVGGRK